MEVQGKIKLIGDRSLSKRDFLRVVKPLKKFGAKFKTNNGKLPIKILGTNSPKPIKYFEKKGSAQCKSSVMLAALNTRGTTSIKAKKSRDHSELLFKNLGLKIKKKKSKMRKLGNHRFLTAKMENKKKISKMQLYGNHTFQTAKMEKKKNCQKFGCTETTNSKTSHCQKKKNKHKKNKNKQLNQRTLSTHFILILIYKAFIFKHIHRNIGLSQELHFSQSYIQKCAHPSQRFMITQM